MISLILAGLVAASDSLRIDSAQNQTKTTLRQLRAALNRYIKDHASAPSPPTDRAIATLLNDPNTAPLLRDVSMSIDAQGSSRAHHPLRRPHGHARIEYASPPNRPPPAPTSSPQAPTASSAPPPTAAQASTTSTASTWRNRREKEFSIFDFRFSIGASVSSEPSEPRLAPKSIGRPGSGLPLPLPIQNPKSKIQNSPPAFSLVELLVTISIIVILVGLTIVIGGKMRDASARTSLHPPHPPPGQSHRG